MKKIYTIGFSGKNARVFFETLRQNNIKRLVDVRLNNVSQLAGFTKKNDLAYFLEKICNIPYLHMDVLAPTKEILDAYKNKYISWDEYEKQYNSLINSRNIDSSLKNIDFNDACLLCSEKTADQCHRRLAAEKIKDIFSMQQIIHL